MALLTGWIDPKTAIVPSSYIYPPTLSVSEVEQLNAEEMTGSQETAVAAGLRQAGVTVTDRVVVQAIAENAPALGHLKAGDFILTVDGKQVSSTEGLRADIRAHQPGERIRFGIERDGTPMTEMVTARPAPDDPKVAAVGITPAIGYDSDVDVSVNLPQQIGGPSAGMMFALALYDKLTPGPLAGGRTVGAPNHRPGRDRRSDRRHRAEGQRGEGGRGDRVPRAGLGLRQCRGGPCGRHHRLPDRETPGFGGRAHRVEPEQARHRGHLRSLMTRRKLESR